MTPEEHREWIAIMRFIHIQHRLTFSAHRLMTAFRDLDIAFQLFADSAHDSVALPTMIVPDIPGHIIPVPRIQEPLGN